MSDRIFGFALLGLGAIIFWSTFNPDWFSLSDKDEARTVLVPRVLLVLIIFMAALLLVRSFLTATKSAGFSEAVAWQDRMGWVRFAMATAIVLGVAFAMPRLGFYLAMVPGIAAMAAAMGLRRWILLTGVALIAPVIAWYIIVQIAELSLPEGKVFSAFGLG
ncbi:tripartite tricarboxylate transporter TctB family protein [Pararhizobium sp. IMCC21322]|uniref:tripartite tricarboxylate transporter TctB family protein n=1 Tax=Pararhizobium sp. IMCC21322 TaxID=3067903 RepID=UPI002740F872|nr:tripartite tricarboxylate transporter TctB family protein [Pararhizobium sp. IMCC21322]